MPQSKRSKRKRNSNRSSIDQHKRSGKELVPPLMQVMGDKLEFNSWMNDRLPEMLWASLVFASGERRGAFREFSRIMNFVAEHERREELKNLTISGIAGLDEELRKEVISFIVSEPATSHALSTLLIFESLPSRADWEQYINDPKPDLDLLMTAVGDTLFHQSPGATDSRWVWTIGMAAAGQMRVHKGLSDYVEAMTNYPDLEPGNPNGARVRASEGGLSKLAYAKSTWPDNFWKEAWEKSPCLQLASRRLDEQVQSSTTRQGISDLIERLEQHWNQTHSTTAVDAKHDAVFGMTFYAAADPNGDDGLRSFQRNI